MQAIRRGLAMLTLMAFLASPVFAYYDANGYWHDERHGFNDEYVFATTRAVNDMPVNPALKLTLYPVTIVLDTAFLPFAVIAGFVTS